MGISPYLSNTLWVAIENLGRLLYTLTITSWVGRYFGPEMFGIYSFTFSFVYMFAFLPRMGLDDILFRELSFRKEEAPLLLGTAFWIRFSGAVAGVIVAPSIGFLLYKNPPPLYIFLAIFPFLFQTVEVVEIYFRSLLMARYGTIGRLIQLTTGGVLRAILILSRSPMIYFFFAWIVEHILWLFSVLYLYHRNGGKPFFSHFSKTLAKDLFRGSIPMLGAGFLGQIHARIEQVFLKEWVPLRELGYYSATISLVEMLSVLPGILYPALFPYLVEGKKISEKEDEQRRIRYYRFHFLLFVLIGTPLIFFGTPIMELLYGKAYRPAGFLLSLLTLRLFLSTTGVARGSYLIREGLYRYYFFITLTGTILHTLFSLLLIPLLGTPGAILGTFLAGIVTLSVDLFFPKTRRNLSLLLRSFLSFYRFR